MNVHKVENDVVSNIFDVPIGETFPDFINNNTIKTENIVIGGGMAGTATHYANTLNNIRLNYLTNNISSTDTISDFIINKLFPLFLAK